MHHKISPLSRIIPPAQYTFGNLREMAGKVAIFLEYFIISRTIILAYAHNLRSGMVLAEPKGGI